MHQYKIVAQILLVLSIFNFNLVFAIPLEREMYDARDDVVVPVMVRNVAAMSKGRRQSVSDGPTPSDSSPPPPDESIPSHSLPPLPDGLIPLHKSPSPPGGPAALAISSPSGGTESLPVVPASDQPVPVHSPSTSRPYTVVTYGMLDLNSDAQMKRFRTLLPAGCSCVIAIIFVVGRLILTGAFLTPPTSPAGA